MTDALEAAIATILSAPPLERREALITINDSLMSESDDAFDIYAPVFDALDQPETITVFPVELRRMELSFKYDGEQLAVMS